MAVAPYLKRHALLDVLAPAWRLWGYEVARGLGRSAIRPRID